MLQPRWIYRVALLLAVLCFVPPVAIAQQTPGQIPEGAITALDQKLEDAKQAKSSARKKLAIRRVIRECESLLAKNKTAPNRFEVLSVLFRTQQEQIGVDGSTANRRALLETSRKLATAPNSYAAIRLDADLLLSQAELAQKGADQQARAEALRPLVDRYQDTEVEAKVIRIAMLMALEFGDAGLIGHLRQVIAERLPGDMEMINFQRDKLAGQVFGAPFIGRFMQSDGKPIRFPMDGLGKTTGLYFWSKEGDGLEQLKLLAEGWKKVTAETDAPIRYQIISFNLDGLPDAGEKLLREAGLDWPAVHLPGGSENPIYKTYVRNHPKLLTMTPTGYTAMVMSGATRVRPDRGWERSFQSRMARSWAKARYSVQLQSLLSGDFLVTDPTGTFDPASPPEWAAIHSKKHQRNADSVPAEKLAAIQACFVRPPLRYGLPFEAIHANYTKADELCGEAIAAHPKANDLWIVRNRRIVALMGLWKLHGQRKHYDAALKEAEAALQQGYPAGADVVARFCVAREALRAENADLPAVIKAFVNQQDGGSDSAPSLAVATLLALETGDRKLHEKYRRLFIDQYANAPIAWNATSFLMDRYHRYWMYHPPFTAGWTYGRRQGHFLSIGTHEDAKRSVQFELKTLNGNTVRIPEDAQGKWSIIEFTSNPESNPYLLRYGTFLAARPFEDVNQIVAVLSEDLQATRAAHAKRVEEQTKRKKGPDPFQTMMVPGGMGHAIVQQLGILDADTRPNILIVRPDGSIAVFLSGLTMSAQKSNPIQNVIERYDEKAVDEALARGDLKEAQRLAFAHAPVKQTPPPDAPRHWKPKVISVPHLRSRAKVYFAMKDYEAALADAQAVYLKAKSAAGYISMRTREYEEAERFKNQILKLLGRTEKPSAAE